LTPEETEFLNRFRRDLDSQYQKIKERDYDIQQKIIQLQIDIQDLSKKAENAFTLAGIILDKKPILYVFKTLMLMNIRKILKKN